MQRGVERTVLKYYPSFRRNIDESNYCQSNFHLAKASIASYSANPSFR